ncbi:MAG: sugar phosphate isomerase/epimerase [Thermoleophilia bacterium]|nr:sugar phosphate isomerase/epimerase [Thermoleophilia bacterium]
MSPADSAGGAAGHEISFIAALDFASRPAAEVRGSLLGAGYDSVEWTMAHVDEMLAPASALACQQDLASGGESAVAITIEAIQKASDAGVGTVNVLTGPNLWEKGARPDHDERAWTQALNGLDLICTEGALRDVRIGLEPCWGNLAHSAETTQRILEAVPVSVTFDPSHFVMTDDPIPELIESWGDRIIHFHLKDAFGREGMDGEDFIFCLLGEGEVPWPETFAALEKIGYEGPMSVEFEAYRYYEQILGSDPEAAAALAMEQVRALTGRQA